MKQIFAIDPGPIESAYVIWDGEQISEKGLHDNKTLLTLCNISQPNSLNMVIEEVQCFGMPVGKSIFETVFWSGRFCETFHGRWHRLPRKEVKLHLCQSVRAKDSNVTQALIDRFAPMIPNKGKGSKQDPGFFYGFKKDIWQAFALAVTFFDLNETKSN